MKNIFPDYLPPKKKRKRNSSISEPLSIILLINSINQYFTVHPMLDEPIRILIAALVC